MKYKIHKAHEEILNNIYNNRRAEIAAELTVFRGQWSKTKFERIRSYLNGFLNRMKERKLSAESDARFEQGMKQIMDFLTKTKASDGWNMQQVNQTLEQDSERKDITESEAKEGRGLLQEVNTSPGGLLTQHALPVDVVVLSDVVSDVVYQQLTTSEVQLLM